MGFARLSFDGRHLLVVVAFALSLVAMPAQATVIFDDGENHDIDSAFDDFEVHNSALGKSTSVRVHPDGDIRAFDGISVSVFDNSVVNVVGALQGDLVLSNYSWGTIRPALGEGPAVRGNLTANDSSRLRVQFGTIAGNTRVKDFSDAGIGGGTLRGDVTCQDKGELGVWGGTIQGVLRGQDECEMLVKGGIIEGVISAEDAATVTLQGRDFLVNGVPVDYGPVSVNEGTIEGTLFQGEDLLSTTFTLSDDAQIVLVPEPSTLVLLLVGGIGALAHVWRRQQRPAAGCRR